MRNFQDLLIWQKSHQLTLKIYSISSKFPKDEMFGLISQIRRSSSSIPTNIAEGCGHDSNNEFKRYLTISIGSVLNYISESTFQELSTSTIELRKMLHSFKQNIR
jgi:four helix bundle protein